MLQISRISLFKALIYKYLNPLFLKIKIAHYFKLKIFEYENFDNMMTFV